MQNQNFRRPGSSRASHNGYYLVCFILGTGAAIIAAGVYYVFKFLTN